MAIDNQTVHRPGAFKQSNKPHKGGHKKNTKGKVENVKSSTKKQKHDLRKNERKNRDLQIRKAKRDEMLMQKRGLGGLNNSPILVAILSLDDSLSPEQFQEDLISCDDDLVVTRNNLGNVHLSFPKQKQRFTFFLPNRHNLHSVMDSLKVADVLILLHPLTSLDEFADNLLSVIVSHALPTPVHIIQGLDKMNPKKKAEYRKNILKDMETRFPNEKLHSADTRQELQLLLRHIGCQKCKPVSFRDSRFHLLAESTQFIPSDTEDGFGTLKVSGFVRGQAIDVNGLVHIPGWGNFQLNQIDYEADPYPSSNNKAAKKSGTQKDEEMSLDHVVLSEKADPQKQVSLQSEVIPDPMEGEQTWPTKEELEAADLKPKKSIKKVTKGTSEYQSAWIVESEDSESDGESEDEDGDDFHSAEEGSVMNEDVDEAMEEDMDDMVSVSGFKDENYDKTMDLDEEKQTLVRFKEERMNEMFPDEIDTPLDQPARTRFQKYRGLKTFGSSPWDPMENLPYDYARIYRFENFKLTKKKAFNSEKEGAKPGLYVTLHIKNVPKSLMEEKDPLIVFGLLPHEEKMSVMNIVIRKHPSCRHVIRNKDKLIFHVGYQRFVRRPIFSEHKTGNKFKMERYLPNDNFVVASFYAPVIFPPAPVVVSKQLKDGTQDLVATGSVLDVNPNRVIVKRVVLSGHPFKINRKTAVIRYMFFNKEDINWFKSVELRTKCGRKGHIRESLGSHGHMKCVFDRQLQSQDVVLMTLYKRVFPKWPEETDSVK